MAEWQIPPKGGRMDLADRIYYQKIDGHQIQERLESNELRGGRTCASR